MSTSWTTEQLNDFLDDRLSPGQRAETQAAIQADPAARHALNELRQLRRAIRKIPRYAPATSLAPAIVARIRLESARPGGELVSNEEVPSVVSPAFSRIRSRDFRIAATAVAALAASLLLAVFLSPGVLEMRDMVSHSNDPGDSPREPDPVELPLPGGLVDVDDLSIESDRGKQVASGESGTSSPEEISGASDEIAESPASAGSRDGWPLTLAAGSVQRVLDDFLMAVGEPAQPGDMAPFDDVIVIKAPATDVQRILARLELAPPVQPAVPDSYPAPSGGLHSRVGKTMEDKSRRTTPQESSAQQEETSSSEPAPELSFPSPAYVSIEGTSDQIEEILGGLGTSLQRVPALVPPNMDAPEVPAEAKRESIEMYRLAEGDRLPAATADEAPPSRQSQRKRVLLIFEKVPGE